MLPIVFNEHIPDTIRPHLNAILQYMYFTVM